MKDRVSSHPPPLVVSVSTIKLGQFGPPLPAARGLQ